MAKVAGRGYEDRDVTFLGEKLWSALKSHGKKSPKALAVAYFSDSVLPLGKGDIVITNASPGCVQTAQRRPNSCSKQRGEACGSIH